MNTAKNSIKMAGAGFLSALLASSCCIVPVLSLIAGSTGLASSFSWVEPIRPYLIAVSVCVLGFAWYHKLKVKTKPDDCCAVEVKPRFIQTTTFLSIVTVFAIAMMTFPLYAKVFYSNDENQNISLDSSSLRILEFRIEGMTCASCEGHIEHAVNKLPGISTVVASYEGANAVIKYDLTQTSLQEISGAIETTGYKIISCEHKK